jgi:peptide/nickel transport system substrate-binding protein
MRKAFMHAIDRQAIKAMLFPGGLGTLATTCLPPGYFGHKPMEVLEYDPKLAKKLMAEAGYPNGLKIDNYFITKSYAYPKIMVIVQEQLRQVGVEIDLQLVEHPTYHANIRRNLNPFVLYSGTRLTDGDVMLSLFFHSDEAPDPKTGNKGTNFAHYRGIDDLLERGRTMRDQAKRELLYHEAQQRIVDDAVCLPIIDVPNMTVRHPKRVSTPFAAEYGEFALHYFYNFPELLKLVN